MSLGLMSLGLMSLNPMLLVLRPSRGPWGR